MKFIQKALTFLVYSNLFIAGCAILMAHQTFHFLLHQQANVSLLFFIFFSTICSYSFHWYLTGESLIPSHRNEWLNQNRKIHLLFFIIGLIGAAIFFFYLLDYWQWLLVSAVITFLYSAPKIPNRYFRALRKVALGKTIFLAMVWMIVTTILPIAVSEKEWTGDFLLFASSRFFLVYGICILFDLRDRKDDKAAGIRSLITYLSKEGITALFIITLVLFAAATCCMLQYGYSIIQIIILLIPGIITACLYNYAKKHFADMLYYFILDGLMAFSAILMFITGI